MSDVKENTATRIAKKVAAIGDDQNLQKILMMLQSRTGHDFALYKKSLICRQIGHRINSHHLAGCAAYVDYLKQNAAEIDVLFNDLLVGVTKFFRDAEAFEALKEQVCSLLRLKNSNDSLRVWVTGCSTGEEAYSIAIIITELLDSLNQKVSRIQIIATDLDTAAIEHARAGIYHESRLAGVGGERLDKFFSRNEEYYSVKADLRKMIVFARHNLIKDIPFTCLDLLCCRNVLIYLSAELQSKIIPLFHYSLNKNGILFLGPAETIGRCTGMFTSVVPRWKIFERKSEVSSLSSNSDRPFISVPDNYSSAPVMVNCVYESKTLK